MCMLALNQTARFRLAPCNVFACADARKSQYKREIKMGLEDTSMRIDAVHRLI